MSGDGGDGTVMDLVDLSLKWCITSRANGSPQGKKSSGGSQETQDDDEMKMKCCQISNE